MSETVGETDIRVRLNAAQVQALLDLGDIYGSTLNERLLHIIVDVLATEQRRKNMQPVTNVMNISNPAVPQPFQPFQIPPQPTPYCPAGDGWIIC